MDKKNTQNGIAPVITMNCGQQGCSIPYIMPYAGTQSDFQRHAEEKFKPFKKAA